MATREVTYNNNTNNVRKTIGMIHRTTKKSELLMRKEPHLPMKEDISKGYMRNNLKVTGYHGLIDMAIE